MPKEKILVVVVGGTLTIEALDALMGADADDDLAAREPFLFRPSPPHVIELPSPVSMPEALRPDHLTPFERVRNRLNRGKHWLRR